MNHPADTVERGCVAKAHSRGSWRIYVAYARSIGYNLHVLRAYPLIKSSLLRLAASKSYASIWYIVNALHSGATNSIYLYLRGTRFIHSRHL